MHNPKYLTLSLCLSYNSFNLFICGGIKPYPSGQAMIAQLCLHLISLVRYNELMTSRDIAPFVATIRDFTDDVAVYFWHKPSPSPCQRKIYDGYPITDACDTITEPFKT